MSDWEVDIRKRGTDVHITNNKYSLFMGDAFCGSQLKFSKFKLEKLIQDATEICGLLNNKVVHKENKDD